MFTVYGCSGRMLLPLIRIKPSAGRLKKSTWKDSENLGLSGLMTPAGEALLYLVKVSHGKRLLNEINAQGVPDEN